jgi:hypothetical protein
MKRNRPRDPISYFQRNSKAMRHLVGQLCACGESRPEALVAGSNPTICAACARKRRGQTVLDAHHPAGKANNPARIPIPVNDHRANLSPAQYDWPKDTWENRSHSPLLAGAACVRGFCDTNTYLMEELLLWIATLLEMMDKLLKERLGTDWWHGTDLEQFSPRR